MEFFLVLHSYGFSFDSRLLAFGIFVLNGILQENSPTQDWIQITIFRLRWTPPPPKKKEPKPADRGRQSDWARERGGIRSEFVCLTFNSHHQVCWPSSKSGEGNRQTQHGGRLKKLK